MIWVTLEGRIATAARKVVVDWRLRFVGQQEQRAGRGVGLSVSMSEEGQGAFERRQNDDITQGLAREHRAGRNPDTLLRINPRTTAIASPIVGRKAKAIIAPRRRISGRGQLGGDAQAGDPFGSPGLPIQ